MFGFGAVLTDKLLVWNLGPVQEVCFLYNSYGGVDHARLLGRAPGRLGYYGSAEQGTAREAETLAGSKGLVGC